MGPVPALNTKHFPRSLNVYRLGLMLPLRGYHWVALLWICFVLDTVAAVRLPGVAWSKLEVWEGSALAGVWLRERVEFYS